MSGEPLTLEVLVSRIPADGKHFRIEPTSEECRAVAEALGIVDVADLTAEIDVRPVGRDGYAVLGTLRAAVVQTDVVTLEPVRQNVSESIDVTLEPAKDGRPAKTRPALEIATDAPEERDVYRGGRIDLGAIILEHLALGLDPYPKAAGVEFPGHIEDVSDVKSSPFSALASLKHKPE